MWNKYSCDVGIKELAIQIDNFIVKNYPNVNKKFRFYYISYFYKGKTILYIWLYKNKLEIFFKDKDNVLKFISDKIPKGITIGFNKSLKLNDVNTFNKTKNIIEKYFNFYLPDE